mmetsp:Transcript_36317/g.60162  ORF Transcript_36317/g.60162 Transcript_36317/m.60162 type:complete len:204 (-) Transcript_36317:1931-2542(-)
MFFAPSFVRFWGCAVTPIRGSSYCRFGAHRLEPSKRVCLSIHDIFLKRYGVLDVKEQKEILHSLGKHKRFHFVVALPLWVLDIRQCCPARARRCMALEGFKYLPAHVTPFWVPCVIPQHPEGFDCLRPANVVRSGAWCHHITSSCELHELRRKACGSVRIHLVACVAESFSKCHVLAVVLVAVLCADNEHGGGEASKVIHLMR